MQELHQQCEMLEKWLELKADGRFAERATGLTIRSEDLPPLDLVHEVRLLLLDVRRESLLLGLLDNSLDFFSLSPARSLSLLLLGTRLPPGVAPELPPELRVSPSPMVEVDCVSCTHPLDKGHKEAQRWTP